MHSQEQRWDHDRDERKHAWRPGDPLTHVDARTVAMLARAPSTSLEDAIAQIEAYADRKAQDAVVRAIRSNNQGISQVLGALGAAMESPVRKHEVV